MYVIFPLEELLDIDSASKGTREQSATSNAGGSQRPPNDNLPPSHPRQLLPDQQSSPLDQQPQQQQQQQLPSVQQTESQAGQQTPAAHSPSKSLVPQTQASQVSKPVPPRDSTQHSFPNTQSSLLLQRHHSLRQPPSNFAVTSTSSVGAKTKVSTSPASLSKSGTSDRASWAGATSHSFREINPSAAYQDKDLREECGASSDVLEPHDSDSFRDYIVQRSDSLKYRVKSNTLPRAEEVRKSASGVLVSGIQKNNGGLKSHEAKTEAPPKYTIPTIESFVETAPAVSAGVTKSQEYGTDSVRSRESSSVKSKGSSSFGRGSLRNQAGATGPRSIPRSVMASEAGLRDLAHPALNDALKQHNSVTFRLVKTVSEFTSQLSRLHERHSEDLQHLVENFRKKNSEIRNERHPCANQMVQAWETLLQEVEQDSQIHSDVAGTLARQVSRHLIEKTFYRKIQARKIFTHRESFDTICAKTEELLKKCRKDYTEAYLNHCRTQNNASLAAYFDAHNAYVQQLHATNGMLQEYNTAALPSLLQELEEVYTDVGNIVADCILQGADIVATKAMEQNRRYENLSGSCRNMDPKMDIVALVRILESPHTFPRPHLHRFNPPQPPQPTEPPNGDIVPPETPPVQQLKNELIMDRLAALASKSRYEALSKEAAELEKQITQLQETQETLLRIQQRSLESCLYNKANEIQEDLSMKRFDYRVAQVHLAAVRSQKELLASRDGAGAESRERKMSGSSSGSMKSKWMKAFKSLKSTSGSSSSGSASGGASTSGRDNEKKNGARERNVESPSSLFESSHIFQEYTYKKITACDVCHQILRGHSRQGLKCRMCKVNLHFECQDKAGKCQPKSRLLRRQRSTSEIESKQIDPCEEDTETVSPFNSFIASQPGRRPLEPSSPTTAPTQANLVGRNHI